MLENQILMVMIVVFIIVLIISNKLTQHKYQKQANKFKSLEDGINTYNKELRKIIREKDKEKNKIVNFKVEYAILINLKNKDDEMKVSLKNSELLFKELNLKLSDLTSDIDINQNNLSELLSVLDLYSRVESFSCLGHYEEPIYLFDTSERFTEEIKYIRQQQKKMITEKVAVTHPEKTIISENKAYNKKILTGQIKLLLTAFNIECDHLIGTVKPANFSRVMERIINIANSLEKSCASLECGFNLDYIELKLEECKLQYQYTLKKQSEQIEQKQIKDQIREEQRAIKEFEKAISEAEKEERLYRGLLDKARKELENSVDEDRIIALQRIQELELQLEEAKNKEARAKSMAQQTRKGHVYVISNVGSFGDGVYKIGLTRRLEPMDRVKELGDASVPFTFDVHAMIYVEDAPSLEALLHKRFTDRRVNAVNHRKEFFNVDLNLIKEVVDEVTDMDVDLKMTALAKDYYESMRLRNEKVIF